MAVFVEDTPKNKAAHSIRIPIFVSGVSTICLLRAHQPVDCGLWNHPLFSFCVMLPDIGVLIQNARGPTACRCLTIADWTQSWICLMTCFLGSGWGFSPLTLACITGLRFLFFSCLTWHQCKFLCADPLCHCYWVLFFGSIFVPLWLAVVSHFKIIMPLWDLNPTLCACLCALKHNTLNSNKSLFLFAKEIGFVCLQKSQISCFQTTAKWEQN